MKSRKDMCKSISILSKSEKRLQIVRESLPQAVRSFLAKRHAAPLPTQQSILLLPLCPVPMSFPTKYFKMNPQSAREFRPGVHPDASVMDPLRSVKVFEVVKKRVLLILFYLQQDLDLDLSSNIHPNLPQLISP